MSLSRMALDGKPIKPWTAYREAHAIVKLVPEVKLLV
jgi:hypothetical protein